MNKFALSENQCKWRSLKRRIVALDPKTKQPIEIYASIHSLYAKKIGLSYPTIKLYCSKRKKHNDVILAWADEWETENKQLLPGAKVELI